MKFNRIMAVIFGFLAVFVGLTMTILALYLAKPVEIAFFILILVGLGGFFWGVKELRKKEITPLGKKIVPELNIKSTTKERVISGLLYATLFIPAIAFLAILFVYFFYGKKSKFMKFHAGESGLLWILRVALLLFIPFIDSAYTGVGGLYIPTNLAIVLPSGILGFLTIVMLISALYGRCFKLSGIFDFLKK